uniref:Uncharacterized protein n=1 Tax=Cucumis melo TaxID=3656 RepID=A0A9I9DF45_CUCME
MDEEVQLRDCPLRGSKVRLLYSEVEDEIRDQSGGHRQEQRICEGDLGVPEFRKTKRSKFQIENRVRAKQYSDEGAEL